MRCAASTRLANAEASAIDASGSAAASQASACWGDASETGSITVTRVVANRRRLWLGRHLARGGQFARQTAGRRRAHRCAERLDDDHPFDLAVGIWRTTYRPSGVRARRRARAERRRRVLRPSPHRILSGRGRTPRWRVEIRRCTWRPTANRRKGCARSSAAKPRNAWARRSLSCSRTRSLPAPSPGPSRHASAPLRHRRPRSAR